MASKKIPDPLARRHLLEQELEPARALKIARAYGEEGRVIDAIAFLRKACGGPSEAPAVAEARERLGALRDEAAAEGDAFLLRHAAVALGEEPSAGLWRRAAEAARAAGKERYAAEAARQAARLEG